MIEQITYLTIGYVLGIISFVIVIRFVRNSRIVSNEKIKYYKELEN